MAVTQSQIDKLEEAMNSGVLNVRDGRREVQYRSIEEMRERLNVMKAELSESTTGQKRIRRLRMALAR